MAPIRTISVASLLLFVVAVVGCDSTDVDESEPPMVVTPEAFSVETFSASSEKSSTGAHLTAAVLRYVPVSVAIGLKYLLIPRLVTQAALNEEPELVDGAWVWTAEPETSVGDIAFRLTGLPSGEEILWSMRITATNAYTGAVEDVELYSGHTGNEGQDGAWELFYPIEGESVNVLNAEFTIDEETQKQITFVVPPEAPEYAGYEVRYERDGDLRTFFWSQGDSGDEHSLTWNPVTGIGSIESTSYLDGARYCWDAQGDDAACM